MEPFCGGSSVGLFLLLEEFVKRITLNDKDRSIYAFWYSVLNYTEELIELIRNTEITIEERKKQKEHQNNKELCDLLKLGFSTLFLNRTNRSGIINAGPIGGMGQSGDYKLDCRFNKENIVERIKYLSQFKQQIDLYNEDVIVFLERFDKKQQQEKSIIYFAPPYYNKASTLYLNHFKEIVVLAETCSNFAK